MFAEQMLDMNISKPFSRFAPEAYDAIWSIALALKGAKDRWENEKKGKKKFKKKLELFDYTRKDLAMDFLEQFGLLKFQGISVRIFKRNINTKKTEV